MLLKTEKMFSACPILKKMFSNNKRIVVVAFDFAVIHDDYNVLIPIMCHYG